MKTISILTLGCKVNQAESTLIQGNLLKAGYSIVPLSDRPAYCVINTCSVTAKSDYQSRQLIRRAVRAGAKVFVTGCYSQLREEEIRKISEHISIVKNDNKSSIVNMLSNLSECVNLGFSCRSRPYIKVQDGCNSACTYCIIPRARGRSRSIQASEVLNQASELESQGYNEVVLTGIHLGSYGRDTNSDVTLSRLVTTLLTKTTLPRIRLSSIEVNEIDRDLIELLKEERLCNHIHVPLQSGDDEVLRRMNRKYRARDYGEVIDLIANEIPHIAIGTDVMVGFPGENETEFLNTKKLLRSSPLAYMHIFPFSPRPGTAAFSMKDQIPEAVKGERYKELRTLNDDMKSAYLKSQIDKILDIIIEEEHEDSTTIGTSSNYLKITVPSNGCPRKSLVYVRVAEIERNILKGFPIEKP